MHIIDADAHVIESVETWSHLDPVYQSRRPLPMAVPRGTDFELRWFTPTVEIDLCGHATLAAAYQAHRKVIDEIVERTSAPQRTGRTAAGQSSSSWRQVCNIRRCPVSCSATCRAAAIMPAIGTSQCEPSTRAANLASETVTGSRVGAVSRYMAMAVTRTAAYCCAAPPSSPSG